MIGRAIKGSRNAKVWTAASLAPTHTEESLRDAWPARGLMRIKIGESRCVGIPLSLQGDDSSKTSLSQLEREVRRTERAFKEIGTSAAPELCILRDDWGATSFPAFDGATAIVVGVRPERIGFSRATRTWDDALGNGDDQEPDEILASTFNRWRKEKGINRRDFALHTAIQSSELVATVAGIRVANVRDGEMLTIPLDAVRKAYRSCASVIASQQRNARPYLTKLESSW